MQVMVTKIMDYITELHGRDRIFDDYKWRELFVMKQMRKRGLPLDSVRSDAGVFIFIYTGLLKTRTHGVHKTQCDFHSDVHNDRNSENGCNINACFSQLVPMHSGNRSSTVYSRAAVPMHSGNRSSTVYNRAAMSQFHKGCNDNVVHKMKSTKNLESLVRKYMAMTGCSGEPRQVNWRGVMRSVREEIAGRERLDYATLQANANKDCHYSWHVYVGWNEYVLVEAIYALSLIPSSIGWRAGVRYALASWGNGSNFITNFIQEMVLYSGGVGYHFGIKFRARSIV